MYYCEYFTKIEMETTLKIQKYSNATPNYEDPLYSQVVNIVLASKKYHFYVKPL